MVGLWSHFASADEPGNPSIGVQLAAFKEALAVAESMGITAQLRHIANTAAALEVPAARYDLVRVGGGSYGLATLPGGPPAWLRPVFYSVWPAISGARPSQARKGATLRLRSVTGRMGHLRGVQ